MIVEKQMECRLAKETVVLGENLPQRHFFPLLYMLLSFTLFCAQARRLFMLSNYNQTTEPSHARKDFTRMQLHGQIPYYKLKLNSG
jgi:hypothetical protein